MEAGGAELGRGRPPPPVPSLPHQGQRGGGRRTERFSFRARSQAAWGVEPISRCFSCVLWWRRSWSMRRLASGRVVTCSAAKRAGRRFCQKSCARSIFPLACGVGAKRKETRVKAQGGAELGKGIWLAGEEKRVVIDVEGEGQTAGRESAGKEVEMSQESLARVEAGQGKKAAVKSRGFPRAEAVGTGARTSDVVKRRTARAGRSAGPASGAPAWGVFCDGCRGPVFAGGPSGGRWRDRA